MCIGNLLPVISWHIGSTSDSRMQIDIEAPLLKSHQGLSISFKASLGSISGTSLPFYCVSPLLLLTESQPPWPVFSSQSVFLSFQSQGFLTLCFLSPCVPCSVFFPSLSISLFPLSSQINITSQGSLFLSMLFTPSSQLSHILIVTFSSQCLITVSKFMFGYMFFNVCLPLAYKLCEFTDLDGFAQLNKYLGNEQ